MKKGILVGGFVLLGGIYFNTLAGENEKYTDNNLSGRTYADGVENQNWQNLDREEDKVEGISTEKAYREVLKDKKSKSVIVAIIDSGIDIEHEDLKDKIWTNEDEIAGNGIDDDTNGYVDDIHGWNFLGNSSGVNISYETLEMTRIVGQYRDKFDGKKKSDVPREDRDVYKLYQEAKKEYDYEVNKVNEIVEKLQSIESKFNNADSVILNALGSDSYCLDELDSIGKKLNDSLFSDATNTIISMNDLGISVQSLKKRLEHYRNKLNYNLNTEFNPRDIIGDDVNDQYDKNYGNNDVYGDFADHGTHVAGIIGASRLNGIGMDGVADNIKIMVLRVVPDGDERDKDVANAIIYAVDNGAQVINMSFGKNFSPQKGFVDNALKYAENKNVLLIHAAGNDATNNDKKMHYPTRYYSELKKNAGNWITVGASDINADAYFLAPFTNYGSKTVDVFAPGVKIYSTIPEDNYSKKSGTSMAAPVVTGLAALLISYYPGLTVKEIRKIILKSATRFNDLLIYQPAKDGPRVLTNLKNLSKSGGIVNAYEAVLMAEKLSGKRK